MRILVCGGRDFVDYDKLKKVLGWFDKVEAICHGGDRGADMLTHRYVEENFERYENHFFIHGEPWTIEYEVFPAMWDEYGKSAGFQRNTYMFTEFKPDLVVAFPGGKVTKHMVDYAKAEGCTVMEIK